MEANRAQALEIETQSSMERQGEDSLNESASARFTFIALFAGIGGLRLALEQAGGQCLFSSEINESAAEVSKNFGEKPHGDITADATKQALPKAFDLLSAGFPCQPFSISGRKMGFQDTRGTLIYEVFDILNSHKPRVVLLENVKHLRYHDGGRTLQVILDSLVELGCNVSLDVLNAANFGVPQNRERIAIVGTRQGHFSFAPLRAICQRVTLEDFLDTQGPFEYLEEPYTLLEAPTVQLSGLIFAGYRNKRLRQRGVGNSSIALSRVHKQPNRIYDARGIHPALPAQETSGRFWILHKGKVRKLTIAECYRIMGFPETFQRAQSLSEQYRQIGNSVCIPQFRAIAEEIVKQKLV